MHCSNTFFHELLPLPVASKLNLEAIFHAVLKDEITAFSAGLDSILDYILPFFRINNFWGRAHINISFLSFLLRYAFLI